MRFSRFTLRALNALLSVVLFCIILTAGAYSAFALWDNNQVYAAAENVQAGLLAFKPSAAATAEERGASFDELLAINPDVCAWLTVDNTKIDYPVLQGEDNLSYINTDVYGKFALAGSIFLDTRCGRDFSGKYSLLYGHHMENSRMFGDLDLFKDEKFFNENAAGTLLLPDRVYDLEIYACLLVPASDDILFEPEEWLGDDISSVHAYVEENALFLRRETFESSKLPDVQVLAMSTCAAEFTDARTIVLAVMKEHMPEE